MEIQEMSSCLPQNIKEKMSSRYLPIRTFFCHYIKKSFPMMSREQMFSGIRDIEVKDALLAEAIQSLSEKRQKVVLQNIVKPKISKAAFFS